MGDRGETGIAKATVQGAFWAYTSTYCSKVLVLVSTIILARLLSKEDFGIAGYALVIIGYLEVLNGLGIGPALIYLPQDRERSTSAFWLGLAMGFALFALTWLIAPYAGVYFNDGRAVAVTRVLGLTFPISALSIVHEALLRKNLAFKLKSIPDFVRAISKGGVSISLAILGFGVWSLIVGQLAGVALSGLAYWLVLTWRPAPKLNAAMMPPLLSYGLNIVSVRALSAVLLNTDYLLVGRFLGATALGIYTLGFRVPNMLIGQFTDVIGQVLFPVYARMGNDPDGARQRLLTTIRYVSLVTVPIGLGLALVARPFVLTLFTEKWVNAIPIVAAISGATVLESLVYNFGDVYKAQGRPEVLTRLSFAKALVLVPALWWAVAGPGTLVAVGWTVFAVSFIGMVTQLIVARRILGVSFLKVLEAVRPAAIGGAAMAAAVLGVLALCADLSSLVQLTLTVSAGGCVFAGTLWWFQRDVILTARQFVLKGLTRRQ